MPRTIGSGQKIRSVLRAHNIQVSNNEKLTKRHIALYMRLKNPKHQTCSACGKIYSLYRTYCDCGVELPYHRYKQSKQSKKNVKAVEITYV